MYSPEASGCQSPLLSPSQSYWKTGRAAQQEHCVCLPEAHLWQKISTRLGCFHTLIQSRMHLSARVFLLICVRCESERGERWSHDGTKATCALSPLLRLFCSEADEQCHVHKHLLLLPLHSHPLPRYTSRPPLEPHIIRGHLDATPAENTLFF